MDAALTLFDAKGVEATSIDEITAAASVAKGTFYVHFQRKQDVLLEHAAQLLEAVDLGGLSGHAAAALRELGERIAATMTATTPRAVTGRMVREIVGNREEWFRVLGGRAALGALIQPVIERGQEADEVRTDLSAPRLAQALVILWLDAVIGWAERPAELPLAEDVARATTLYLDGVRSSRP